MPALFEAYVTNLGKYNEGELVGEYLKFPTTPEEVQALLKRIGIDGVRYEEIFITDFDGDVLGLYDHLGEYENIDELNHLACVISELDQGDLEKFEAVIDSGEYTGSVKELINLAQNLDCFEFYPGVTDDETLGRIYVEDMEAIDVPEHLLNYFDYEAYGRDIRLNEDGHYAPGGYVLNNGGSFIEHYHGREDIQNQKKILQKAAKDKGYTDTIFFVDDGITGTTMKRPGFQKMIAAIEAGYISAVFVKDLSRLGRNYIEVGKLTEEFFPLHDVRLVAVSDGVDSDEGEDDFTPFKNIMKNISCLGRVFC